MRERWEEVENLYTKEQRNQIRIAKRQGLDITKLMNPDLTYKQMEVLRQALLEGIDISTFCHPGIPVDEMKRQIANYEKTLHIIDKAKEEYKQKRIKTFTFIFAFITLIVVVLYLMYSNKEFLIAYFNTPVLELTEEKISLNISEVDEFNPLDYIKKYDKAYEINFDGEEHLVSIGNHKLTITQSNGVKETTKYLYITVIDDIAPDLKLSKSKITLSENDDFNPVDYLDSAKDNVDGDLYDKVKTSEYDVNKEIQVITYYVVDSAGNEATEKLTITTKKETQIIINSSSSNSASNEVSNNSSTNNTSSTSSSTGAGYSGKFYSIDIYGTFDACIEACQQDLAGKAGICSPVKDEDGIYIGYRMTIN